MKTALVLAGGGSRGAYEMGVWQALREMGIKIDIVTGTSIGSMNATLVANDSFEAARELWLTLKTDEVFDYRHAIENKGVKFTSVKDIMAETISEEKVRSSGVDLGIVTVKFPSLEPVYDWKEDIPEGELLDYVFASCSCFPVVMPYEIDGEKYIDGGFVDTMPIGMALQKDPDLLIAVNLDGVGKYQEFDVELPDDRFKLIESHWDLGNFAVFDPSRSALLLRLGYLDTLKAFGAFSGRRYTFFRGQFNLKNLNAIEEAALSLDMDPTIIYTRDVFEDEIKKRIRAQKDELKKTGKELKEFDLFKLLLGRKKKEPDEEPLDVSRISIIALCEFLKKNPEFKISRALRMLLGGRLPAAQWLIAEGLYQ